MRKNRESSMVVMAELVRLDLANPHVWTFRTEACFDSARVSAEMAKVARALLSSFIPTLRAEDELPIASVHDISSSITPKTVASLRATFVNGGIVMDDFVTAMVKVRYVRYSPNLLPIPHHTRAHGTTRHDTARRYVTLCDAM